MKNNRGFTLIELLVVIAIIGILSAVVLASLNTARGKGSNAAIMSDLNTVQTQAEIYYGTQSPNVYGTVGFVNTLAGCTASAMFADPNVKAALTAAYSASGSTAGNLACVAAGQTYAIAVKLTGTPASWWCVDSSGVAKSVLTGTTAFPTAPFTCP
ncbi:MAG: type II secretion system protein [Candidatus Paceibacterota bacterium]|jgi:prepilin-type N-terminal cleavage/methylation domain-containing protein